jgi:hypothetical protein
VNTTGSGFKLDGRTIGIGLLILIAAVIFLPRILNPGTTTSPDNLNPGDQVYEDDQTGGNIRLGQAVLSPAVDRDGCPVETASSFDATDEFYVVAPNSDIPAGTSVFVRLYHEDTPVEDAPEITADQDYTNTCINFVFEPADGSFDTGNYQAEFFVNGNPAQSINFDIR